MACPFIDEVVDEGAIVLRRAFQRDRAFRDRSDPLAFNDSYLYERYRFSRDGIAYICRLLNPYIANNTRRNRALTVPQTVCIALRFFASGTFLYTVGDAENISKASVCRSVRTVYLSLKRLLNVFITFPGHKAIRTVRHAFYGIAGFPNVIGALGCTHVRIKCPSGPHEADFVNRKSVHSINVQMISDADCIVTNVEAKWPGSVHDCRIFRASSLYQQVYAGEFSGVLLGDKGHPCLPYLLTPYQEPQTGPQNRFNVALSKTRVRIEMTFGILKARFNCLRRLRVSPERASQIVAACAILHNIAIIRKERVPPQNQLLPDETDPITLDHPAGAAVNVVVKVVELVEDRETVTRSHQKLKWRAYDVADKSNSISIKLPGPSCSSVKETSLGLIGNCSTIQERSEVADELMLDQFFGCESAGELSTVDSVKQKKLLGGEDAEGNASTSTRTEGSFEANDESERKVRNSDQGTLKPSGKVGKKK
ncbi:putative nuclease HARBI1 [Pseudorasbora parva]|uniref:putative nuclease HARBI1 n=1 Tax=Pseudorasbora parva TaxID=51549 RepID=UPI00351E9F57